MDKLWKTSKRNAKLTRKGELARIGAFVDNLPEFACMTRGIGQFEGKPVLVMVISVPLEDEEEQSIFSL